MSYVENLVGGGGGGAVKGVAFDLHLPERLLDKAIETFIKTVWNWTGACSALIAVIPILHVCRSDRNFQGIVEVAQVTFLFQTFQALSCSLVDYNTV